jgi:hypothetical protein
VLPRCGWRHQRACSNRCHQRFRPKGSAKKQAPVTAYEVISMHLLETNNYYIVIKHGQLWVKVPPASSCSSGGRAAPSLKDPVEPLGLELPAWSVGVGHTPGHYCHWQWCLSHGHRDQRMTWTPRTSESRPH